MSIRTRLIFLLISFVVLLAVGRAITGDFSFIFDHFWFTSGFFLLLLLSLIDQPHFSRDANIFVNSTTAWVSLLLIPAAQRNGIWWGFFTWASYLIVSSYILMWMRSRELQQETTLVQIVSRLNRQIGRPEALFSAFFLWGSLLQFGTSSGKLSALFLFWAIFMILNLPALSGVLDNLLTNSKKTVTVNAGVLLNIINPRIAEVSLSTELPSQIIGRVVAIMTPEGVLASKAVIIDDRIIYGQRVGRVAIIQEKEGWRDIGTLSKGNVRIDVTDEIFEIDGSSPISVVDSGTEIGKLVFYINPNQQLEAGEVLWVYKGGTNKTFYQVISALVCQLPLPDGNHMHSVKVTAGQLGNWNNERCRFEPITWVAPAGQMIYRAIAASTKEYEIHSDNQVVGYIPHSDFPVHVSNQDIVTHNTAIIGVTGSGKSYLAFHLIEAMVRNKIKVLILDISRQHDLYLAQHTPTALRAASDVASWFVNNSSMVGIHQFGVPNACYPQITADFVDAAYAELSKATLERGKNMPARLCIVFEEAHSLIPEWNQVAQQSDVGQVNRTARKILQGRKYGMGALIITQRTANVTKTILNQCNTIFALQSFDQTGLDFLRNYMGEEYSHAISTLPIRHAILVGKASSSTRPLLMTVEDMAGRWKEVSDAKTIDCKPTESAKKHE